ncbi:hypothetical protein PMAYCL1PPCAC_08870, partial [Pristionchus mayeri]
PVIQKTIGILNDLIKNGCDAQKLDIATRSLKRELCASELKERIGAAEGWSVSTFLSVCSRLGVPRRRLGQPSVVSVCHMPVANLRIGTINCRTLKKDDRVAEIEDAVSRCPFDVIALQEIRRKGQTCLTLAHSQHLLVAYGTQSAHGTGFLVSNRWANSCIFHPVNERISYLDLPTIGLRIITAYAPTSAYPDHVFDRFLNDLSSLIATSARRVRRPGGGKGHLVVLGDFNSKIGSREENTEKFIGVHGYGERNERGQTLVDFCNEVKLYVQNTRFQKRETRKWTWLSPNMRTRNAIDYVMSLNPSIVQDVTVIGSFDLSTDHRLLMAKVRIQSKVKQIYHAPKPVHTLDQAKFAAAILSLQRKDTTSYESLASAMRSVANDSMKVVVKEERFSHRTKRLFIERRRLRDNVPTPINRVMFSITSKALRI